MNQLVTDGLEAELAKMIIEVCHIPDPPEKVDPEAPLIGPDSPLGLDSLDAVEVVAEVQKRYDARISQDRREVLRSLATLAEFIRREKGSL